MLTNFNKIYPLEIDIKNLQTTYNSKALYANNDLNTSVMLVKLSLDGKGLDITDKAVTAYIKTTSDNNITMQRCEVLDATNGVVGLDFKKGALKVGTNIFFMEIKSANDEIINTPLIEYKVVELFDTSCIFEGEENSNILSQLITDVEASKSSLKRIDEEIDLIKSSIEGIDTEGINSIKNEVDTIKTSMQLTNDEISSIKSEIESTKSEVEAIDVDSIGEEINIVKNEIDIVKNEVNAIKEEVGVPNTTLINEIDTIKDEIGTIKTSIAAIDVETISTEIDTIKDNLEKDRKLIFKYVHNSNKTIKPSSLDLETGVFTCVNHGLSNNTKIVPVQDNFTDKLQNIHVELFKTGSQNLTVTEVTKDTFKVKNVNGTINSFETVDNQESNIEKYHFEVLSAVKMDFTDIETDGNMEIKIYGHCGIGDLFFGLLKDGVLHETTNCFGGTTFNGAIALSRGVQSNFRMFFSTLEIRKTSIGYMISYDLQQHYINNGRTVSSSNVSKQSSFIQYPHDNVNGIRLGSSGHFWQPMNGMTLEIYSISKEV